MDTERGWGDRSRSLANRHWLELAVLLVAAVAGSFATIQGVGASQCVPKCYTKDWQDGSFAGVKATWDLQDLNAVDWSTSYGGYYGFVVQDLWAGTRFDQYGQWQEWVEVGYRHGFDNTDWRGFFWGVSRWDSGAYRFIAHQISSPLPGPTGTAYEFKIEYGGDIPGGEHVYYVYINGQCVQSDVGCGALQANWIQRHQVGGEATDDANLIGPTHVRNIQYRSVGAGNWSPWIPGTPQVDRGSYVWTWYGDYNTVLYYMQNIYLDPFEAADGSDPGWPKGCSSPCYWHETPGGNIFIHRVLSGSKDYSHLHLDYWDPSGYLLMRRDKWDGYTGSPIVVEFGFGDDMATQAGRFFGVWSTGDSAQLAIGVKTNQFQANNYFYRVDNSFYDTGIARTNIWHIFRVYVTSSGCSYGELDGTSLAGLGTNCSITPTSFGTWGVASTWGLTDPLGTDAIWDNAVYFHR